MFCLGQGRDRYQNIETHSSPVHERCGRRQNRVRRFTHWLPKPIIVSSYHGWCAHVFGGQPTTDALLPPRSAARFLSFTVRNVLESRAVCLSSFTVPVMCVIRVSTAWQLFGLQILFILKNKHCCSEYHLPVKPTIITSTDRLNHEQ